MNRFKRWVVVAWMGVASALGIQYKRAPVIEHRAPAVEVPVTVTPPQEAPSTLPVIELQNLKGAYGTEIEMVKRSFVEANDIMATECFKTKVLDEDFTETQDMDNIQIYALLAMAPKKVNAEMYDGSWWENYMSKTMGYDVGDGTVYMNRFYADTTAIVRALIVHEGEGHGNGFRHDGTKSTSVPYKLGDFMDDCAPATGLK